MAGESWLDIPAESGFSLDNIPFGIISHAGSKQPHAAVAIGSHVLDLKLFSDGGGFSGLPEAAPKILQSFSETTLNFAELGRPLHNKVREYLGLVLALDTPFARLLRDNASLRSASLVPLSHVETHLPLKVGDYTDFYVGKNHAYNVGVLFRGSDNALQPNYSHLPVGYHGRASSIIVSGTPLRRPWGQILDASKAPIHQPSRRLDIELELGAFVCRSNALGSPVPITEAEKYIFGYVLLNDWSARDIQAWEYVPLGPFNAKNFASTISAWVVLADALEPFRTEGIKNDHKVLPYLQNPTTRGVFDINLEVSLNTETSSEPSVLTRSNGKYLLWSFPQMVVHHTAGGCPLNPGDLIGSGTISGPDSGTQGSLLEITSGGSKPVILSGGESRTFLADGDEVVFRGWCERPGIGRVGFGECRGRILAPWPSGYSV
ncbi:fumarylacetoacetate hydrolase family protein [Grosmannia clavigera kw1407]|uniref:Fumarylacetoacetase n=1 Tax=Grosmannia clavigera (strain kw1407 / UAMH 11150) TaxID=655863 RepID=F0XQY3_GROCL|nr:fumarylacetoacetate hydrolase family protein [Grosmannia clavigera kw1407]EFW99954.1 fumarylacetoacetate hydrolase family protein [Grosmannia clavigera kw1407]